MDNISDCQVTYWSHQAANIVRPIFYICIIATINHVLFWIQFIIYPSVRQCSMQWIYAYLLSDFLLIIRFFLFYAYRWSSICIPSSIRLIICYCEAIFDNYLNLLQSYVLLALNICRYLQIVHNHNVYSLNRSLLIFVHLFIYIVPLVSHIIAILCGWSKLDNPSGDACDLLPVSSIIRIIILLFSYFIPVVLTLIFLSLILKYIHNTDDIRTKEIADARLKHHRQLVIQSVAFYSVWLILWSPHLLIFPFSHKSSRIGIIAQILNYLSITVDPIIIACLDARFLQAWRSTKDRIKTSLQWRQSVRVPAIMLTSPSEDLVEPTSSCDTN